MQRKNCAPAPQFGLKDRSNQELVDRAKSLVGRHRTVTAHLIAHLAEIYARSLHIEEGFSYLGDYCVGVLGMSEDEANRRAHAAVLAQKYPVILDMLLEGSIHLSTLRIVGKCLTPQNHKEVLEAARGKNRTELEHLAAALCPKPDVPSVLRKLPEPRSEAVFVFMGANVDEGANSEFLAAAPALPVPPPPPPPAPRPKSRLAPLAPQRYNLQVTVDEETYNALKQLQDLLRHQVRNGDLGRIIKDAVLERLEHVKREKFGHKKRSRKAREQESWIEIEKSAVEVSAAGKEPASSAGEKTPEPAPIASGRLDANSRHIPIAVRREVWERDNGQCAFVGRSGRRCAEEGRLEFHHVHAYALGGPATVENIALRCRTHNAYEGAALFAEKKFVHPGSNAGANRPGAIVTSVP